MKAGEVNLTKFPQNDENPFLKQAVEEVQEHVVKKWKVSGVGTTSRKAVLKAVNDDGEFVGTTAFMHQMFIDEDKFTKFYLSQFEAFFNLSQAGVRVLGYFMQAMKPKKDMVIFDLDECVKYTGYKSKATIYKGLTELLKAGVIARGNKDWKYFINPLIIFNGDRVSFAYEYIKVKKNADRLEGEAKAARHERITKEATSWKVNEEIFFNGDEGKEPGKIIDIDGDDVTVLLYPTNTTVTVSVTSDMLQKREPTLMGF